MILNSASSDLNFPSEKIDITINTVDTVEDNARVGVRFRHFYYNTLDSKLNFSVASSYGLVSDDGSESLSAFQPLNFLSPSDFNPYRWNVGNYNEYLYVSYNGGLSGVTVWPTHPYPRIIKTNNNTLSVETFLALASAFDGEVKTPQYREIVRDSNYFQLSSSPAFLTTSTTGYVYASRGVKGYEIGFNRNFLRTFSRKSLSRNLIDNSIQIEVPVVTSKVVLDDTENQIFRLQFFDDNASSKRTSNGVKSVSTSLRTLTNTVLEDLGITYPYANSASYNNATGALSITFKAPLFINKFDYITACYETSTTVPTLYNSKIRIVPTTTNNFTITSEIPVYFWNYRFRAASPASVVNTDAYTINFQSSSFTISDNYSSVDVRSVMVDNYYQNQFSIVSSEVSGLLAQRFVEENNEQSLSALLVGNGGIYKTNQWMPAGYDMRFFNSGLGDRYGVKIQLSSFTGAIYQQQESIDLLLNKKNIIFNLNLQESGETSAHCVATIFPSPAENGYGYKWAAIPPENVVFRNLDGDELSQDVLYENEFEAQVFNLGVDKTEIVLYSQEYDTSASTFWFPPSTVVNNMYLELKGEVQDFNQNSSGTVSAFCNRGGFSYRVPVDATIIWNEAGNDSRANLDFYTKSNLLIDKGTAYASSNDYSLVDVSISSIPVEQYPHNILFDVNCNLFRNDFSMNASKLFFIREYPSKDYININATSASNTQIISSSAFKNKILTSPATLSLTADYPNLITDSSMIFWNITNSNGVNIVSSGDFATFSLSTISACVTVSAISATPFEGNFKAYNFVDSICFYVLSATPEFNYIAFPENQYSPIQTAASITNNYQCGLADEIFNIYNNTNGMTAYKSCHTENFYFSATPGFDLYVWNVGDIVKESTSNKVVIPVTYQNVSATGNVSVTAYNSIFIKEDSATVFNSASSDGGNLFKQPIVFYDFPTPSLSISMDNDYYNIDKYSETPEITYEFDSGYQDIQGYTLNLVLSSSNFFQTKVISDKKSIANTLLKIGLENSDFIINENSLNFCNVYLSGNVVVNMNGFDFCAETKPVSSNIIPLTAYNGPNLELYCLKNVVSSGEVVWFYNGSNANFASGNSSQFVSFIFDNGDGTLQTTTSAYITASYISQGVKSPSMTGVTFAGQQFEQVWDRMVYVKNSFDSYDSSISRGFSQDITLPYSLRDVLVKPNDWQYASVINSSFEKLKTNLDYLSSSCSTNNITFPKAYGGFLGSKYGNFKWNTKYSATGLGNSHFKELKCVQYVNDKILVLNGTNIEVYTFDEKPELLYSFNRIGDGETLENPTKLYYSSTSNRLYILDSGKLIMFVCEFDIDSPSQIKLTHYWGGTGDINAGTKLNDPVDFCLDSSQNLYILDGDSLMIKVYNANLNWTKNINLTTIVDSKPSSIDCDGSNTFIITSISGITAVTDLNTVQAYIQVNNSKKSFFNQLHSGILYVISGDRLLKYMKNGTFVSEKVMSFDISYLTCDSNHLLVVGDKCISKNVDFVEIDKIINNLESLSGFSWNSIYVSENELVSDYVYNDSFKKIFDNIKLLNSRIESQLILNYDEFGSTISQYTTGATLSSLATPEIFIATNEPVLYDTINRSITLLYNSLETVKENIMFNSITPNNNNNLQWIWKYHYIDRIQKPTLNKNPVTWRELRSDKIIGNTQLSGTSAWYVIRDGNVGGNHSEICWNYQFIQGNSYFPLQWRSTENNSISGHTFTWNDLEKNCCVTPDYIFTDCVSSC